MGMSDAFVQEMDQEGATTRRLLERVPTDQLSWKPHAKSMSLGELALHVASIPGFISGWAVDDSFNFGTAGHPQPPASTDDVLKAHDAGLTKAKQVLSTLGDAGLQRNWEATMNGATMFSMPKLALVRSILLNHWYHHRGQLSVYLRLLNVPLPPIYGPSADENPFAAQS
jgi:uncharacterized damage-inducible protein DinB